MEQTYGERVAERVVKCSHDEIEIESPYLDSKTWCIDRRRYGDAQAIADSIRKTLAALIDTARLDASAEGKVNA
jgi:FtsZ-interacting cell division protein YlmF